MNVARRLRIAAPLVVFGAALLGATEPTVVPPTPAASVVPNVATSLTPDAIYLRAVRAMKAEPQPAFVVFDEDVKLRNARLQCTADGTSITLKHGDDAGRYRVWFRVRDGASVSQDAVTHTICHGGLLQPAGDEIASLGTASASPAPGASPTPGPGDVAGAGGLGGPALIGSVRVEAARFYHIELVDREIFEGHDVYRLALRAYRDPNAHPITELLIDTETFLVRRASGEVSGHYVIASGRGAGSIVFDRAGPYWIVRDENFELAANALFIHVRTNLAVRGSDYLYADALPGVTFPTPEPKSTSHAKS